MGRVFADNMSNEWQINQKKEKEEKRREVNNNIIKIFLLIEVYTTMYKNKKKKKYIPEMEVLVWVQECEVPYLQVFLLKLTFVYEWPIFVLPNFLFVSL